MTNSWRYFDIARQKRAGNSNNSISNAVVTPGYMISCEKLFDSDISEDKYKYMENASPCDYMHISIKRPNTRDSGGEERDGRMIAGPLRVGMRDGLWTAKLGELITKADIKKQVEVHSVKIVNGELVPKLRYKFVNCSLIDFEQENDLTYLLFSYTEGAFAGDYYDPATNTKKGSFATHFDFAAVFSSNEY